MPAGFAAIGGMAMFSGIAGAIGATMTGVLVSAAVGAAIGGLSAAVMGGDIGKGMLFGAIGGVVTGGIAGGSIANAFGGTAGSGVISPASGTFSNLSAVGNTTVGNLSGTLGTPAQAAVGNTFGNSVVSGTNATFMGKMFEGSGGALIQGAGALFFGGEEGVDIADREDRQQHDKDMANIAGSYRGGSSSSGHAPNYTRETTAMKEKGAMQRLVAQGVLDTSNLKLQGNQKLAQDKQSYALQRGNTAAEFKDVWDKQKAGATTAGEQVYVSGADAYEKVLEAQEAKGDVGSGRPNSALRGYPQEAVG